MIKAKTKDTIILGLSDENIKRLQNNEPILFDLDILEIKPEELPGMKVLIFNGRTEESMYESMLDGIDLKKTKLK
jgi:hypothetical protein